MRADRRCRRSEPRSLAVAPQEHAVLREVLRDACALVEAEEMRAEHAADAAMGDDHQSGCVTVASQATMRSDSIW